MGVTDRLSFLSPIKFRLNGKAPGTMKIFGKGRMHW